MNTCCTIIRAGLFMTGLFRPGGGKKTPAGSCEMQRIATGECPGSSYFQNCGGHLQQHQSAALFYFLARCQGVLT
jgi:hypothetical protein